MNCPDCTQPARKFGKNRNGSQRHRCDECRKTFTDPATRPADRRELSRDLAELCLRMLLEGASVRSTERITGVHRDTILGVLVDAGRACERFLDERIRNVPVDDIEADELWGFVGCKERTRQREGYDDSMGDAWCFVALERTTKLVLAWHLGKRTSVATHEFARKLRDATAGWFQLSTDGFVLARPAVTGGSAPARRHAAH